ncbi:MAG: Na(+)-translocating NADH-quinone reductase subunit A [Maritimibacter sp.]
MSGIADELTEEAGLTPEPGEGLRVQELVETDDLVRQGQPVLRLRAAPEIVLTAPMGGRVASIQFRPGHRLVQLVLFREDGADREQFATDGAEADPVKLRQLMQGAGLWRALRSRPFGHMPHHDEAPTAIFVMAADTRPGAADPIQMITGREEDFSRGLMALSGLTEGPIFVVAGQGALPDFGTSGAKLIHAGKLHPMGMAGMIIHQHFPARPDRRVWDIHAEDVADLGALLLGGLLPATKTLSLTGAALREPKLLRCQPGADLRGLSQPWVKPGLHEVLTGSPLDGKAAHWLGTRDRQASILPVGARKPRKHWFQAALATAARPLPIIPTAALIQAMGGRAMPVAALIRALGAGDGETAVRLGVLSLLEEDMALADYVSAADPPLSHQLREILDRVKAEEGEA